MEVSIKVEGLDEALAMMEKEKEKFLDAVRGGIMDTIIDITADARDTAPVDTGAMQNEIGWRTEDDGLTGVVEGLKDYTVYVDKGTKPHMPPPSALAAWARRHGMPGAEYAIAKKIAQRGTPPKLFMTNSWEHHKDQVSENIKRRLAGL